MTRGRFTGAVLTAWLVGALLAGCSGGTTSSSTPGSSRVRVPTRPCASAVSGALPAGWQADAVRAGPVWLYLWGAVHENGHAGVVPASRFAAVSAGRFNPWKAMVIVPPGRTVVVRVPDTSSPRLRLAFQVPLNPPMRLADGQTAERFVACSSTRTFFNGGLVVAGAQCAHLVVESGGGPTPVVAALGRRRCP